MNWSLEENSLDLVVKTLHNLTSLGYIHTVGTHKFILMTLI